MLKNDILINIIADDREQKSDVIRSLSQIENVVIQVQRLSMGDYQVDNRVVLERKTLKDFAISIVDGRLFRQMIRLANSTFMGVLILEGTGKKITENGVTREAMQGALITVLLILGIPVLRAKPTPHRWRCIVVYLSWPPGYLKGKSTGCQTRILPITSASPSPRIPV